MSPMKIPTFSYMGGKARLRKKLLLHFPKIGNRYIEPFCGVGNMFFLTKTELNYKYWVLNDKYSKFLQSLKVADFNKLPEMINKEIFNQLKELKSPISYVMEPKITFGGKGYASGFSGTQETNGSHVIYNKERYKKLLELAKTFLDSTVYLFNFDYLNLIAALDLQEDDFLYIDPPYYGTKASYPNINHAELAAALNNINAKWALSGYANQIYEERLLYKNKIEFVRHSEIKQSNTRKAEPVQEILWMNYYL